ncbi:MAG: VCBS repeat-containing protein [Planctomycetes bacterium]|nr:VCBS repeat-containing protein [Planctomycetota bacterium]
MAPFPLFEATLDHFTGAQPLDVAAGDVNGDGLVDLVVPSALPGHGAFTVFLGRGNGDFDDGISTPIGNRVTGPASVALADLDADGDVDLVLANVLDSTLGVFENDGAGRFTEFSETATEAGPVCVRLADFTGDGAVDLVVACRRSGAVLVERGFGDGTFGAPSRLALPCGTEASPVSIAVFDFDGDSLLDLAIADETASQVVVALGTGVEPFFRFTSGSCSPVGARPSAIAMADVDRDGFIDVVTANPDDDSVSVMLAIPGSGGAFAAATRFPTGPRPGSQPAGIVLADVNGDGRVDVVTTNRGNHTLSVLAGDGAGAFAAPEIHTVGEAPVAAAAVDVDRDGRLDVIVANSQSNAISVLLARERRLVSASPVKLGLDPVAAATGDLDDDGALDVVTANAGDATLTLLRGDGAAGFARATSLSLPPGSSASDVVLDDFDVDGHLDIAVAEQLTSTIYVFLGDGALGFRPPVATAMGEYPVALASADFDGDGIPDLAVASQGVFTIVWLGDGTGRFVDPCGGCQYWNDLEPQVIRPGDFDGDGRLDLAVFGIEPDGGKLSILVGDGAGRFVDARDAHVPLIHLRGAAVADLDGDGDLDAVACGINDANTEDGFACVFQNDGSGRFEQSYVHVGSRPESLVLTDFDADGRLDLAVALSLTANVSVFAGDGRGGFPGAIQAFGASVDPVRVLAADLDGSTTPEILVVNRRTRCLSVLRNRS